LKAQRKKIHRPDEISAKEISLGRRRALPPASPSCRVYEPEAIGRPTLRPVSLRVGSLRAGLRLVGARSYASERSGPGFRLVEQSLQLGEWETAEKNQKKPLRSRRALR